MSRAQDPQGFPALIDAYLEWLQVKHYAARTVEHRRRYLGYFVAWCQERSLMRPQAITLPILERYQRFLYYYRKANGQPLSVRSQHIRLSSVRALFKWLTRKHYLLYNPASEIDLPKLGHRLPRQTLTAHEADQVLRVPDLTDPLGLRDRAILETLYSTGMRRLEVIHLTLYDLDQERGTVLIRQGKGDKDRLVPIGQRALVWIERYVHAVRPRLVVEPDAGVLFLTVQGEALAPNWLTERVGAYVEAAKIGKHGSCHLFRHTMATLMLEHGADIRFIQQMLGHARLDTTQMYTQVAIRTLKTIHTATHPGARLQRPDATLPTDLSDPDLPVHP